MSDISNNILKGRQAEFLVSSLLGKIFDTNINRHTGDDDKGIDLSLKFESPINRQLFDINFQIKTGKSYIEEGKKYWKICKIEKERFEQWKNSIVPVVLVWVNDTIHPEICYWKLITNSSSFKRLLISKKSILSPSTLFELIIYLGRRTSVQTKKITEIKLIPKINISIREFAKVHFKNHLLSQRITNPILGEVEITWNLWHHLTDKSRKKKHIYFSLEILPIIPDAIKYCNKVYSIRRVKNIIRGNWTTEIKFIVFKINNGYLQNENSLFLVVRETLSYPNNWKEDLLMIKKIKRHLSVESIYRKVKLRPSRNYSTGPEN